MTERQDNSWVVSSRPTGSKSSHQVTIPAALARQLPEGKSVRWELTITEDGFRLRYLGADEPTRQPPKPHVPWLNGDAT